MKVRIAALHYTHFLGVVTANVFYISLTFVHSPSSALAADGTPGQLTCNPSVT